VSVDLHLVVEHVFHLALLVDEEGGAAIDAQHRPDDPVHLADAARLVADEVEVDVLALRELALAGVVVDADSDQHGALRLDQLLVVAERADLDGARGRERLGKKNSTTLCLPR